MKKLITVFFSLAALAVFTSLNAQTDFSNYNDDFSSYANQEAFEEAWEGYGYAMRSDVLQFDGDNQPYAEFVMEWAPNTIAANNQVTARQHFGVFTNKNGIAATSEDQGFILSLSMDVGTNPLPLLSGGAAEPQSIRLEILTTDETFSYSKNVTEGITGIQEYEFAVNQGDKPDDKSLDLENITGYQFVFGYASNASDVASQTVSLHNITFSSVPEPSVYALLAGLLSLGWISIKRRIR